MLGDIYTDNLVEVDNIIDNTFNAPAFPGKFFIPTMNDTGIYSLSFNFRVAPNYLDYDNKFTLFYENSSGHPVQDRLSTPMIKKWWIVGLPYRESGEPYIYEVGTRPRGEADIPGPGAGKISDILTEYDGITDTSRENFNETHGYFKEAIDRGSPGRQLRSMSYMYLHDEYCDRIVDHVENVAAGTDSIYDIGTVYCSGYNTIPSGFMDFHNQKFTSTYNGGVLSSGVVPVGTYGIFLIVEDTLGHRTGLDLIKCTNLGAINYFPTLASFNYGV
jgi:hypothetical protein